MAMGLAGRASEKLVFNEVNSGARSDLQSVNDLARTMVCKFGMGEKTGGVIFTGSEWGWAQDDMSHVSEEEKALIFEEVKGLVDEAEGKARQVMVELRPVLDRIAEELLKRETLTADELREIAGFSRDGDGPADGNGSVARPTTPAGSST